MSEIKLKPCPFCGGKSFTGKVSKIWMEAEDRSRYDDIYSAQIICNKCGAEIEAKGYSLPEHAWEEAAFAWNTRGGKPADTELDD